MADLLPAKNEPHAVEVRRKAQFRVADLLADGLTTGEVAKRLSRGDPAKAKRWRQRMRRWMIEDEAFQALVASLSLAETRMAVPGMTQALIKRARRGRPDAIKLAFEVAGYHNSKVQHDHSGEIHIKLDGIPRPEPVVDAEVVE